jgi:hypothetical protein
VGIAAARETRLTRGTFATRQSIPRAAAHLLVCAGVLICSPLSDLHAQRVEFRPVSGLHLPTRVSLEGGSLDVQQKLGFKFGARLALIFSDRFDMVTAVTYIPGYAIFRGAGKEIMLTTASHTLSGSTTARYWLKSPVQMLAWEIHTGLGVGFGGQAAYEDLFETSTVSGLIGTMVRYQMGRLVRLQLGLQARLFRARLGPGDPPSKRSPIQMSFGLGLPFLEGLH